MLVSWNIYWLVTYLRQGNNWVVIKKGHSLIIIFWISTRSANMLKVLFFFIRFHNNCVKMSMKTKLAVNCYFIMSLMIATVISCSLTFVIKSIFLTVREPFKYLYWALFQETGKFRGRVSWYRPLIQVFYLLQIYIPNL